MFLVSCCSLVHLQGSSSVTQFLSSESSICQSTISHSRRDRIETRRGCKQACLLEVPTEEKLLLSNIRLEF